MSSNVIAGEGVESDDDDDNTGHFFMKNTMVTNTMAHSTMVSGEASETDEEDNDDKGDPYGSPMVADTLSPNVSAPVSLMTDIDIPDDHNSTSVAGKNVKKAKRQKLVYKYDSPFHRKLREKNIQLRTYLVEGITQMYKSAAIKLHSSTYYLTKAQVAVQEVAYNTKIMVDDLHSLDSLLQQTSQLNFLSNIELNTD